jgi:glycosyltransferase involved in cell wall biosynthesis
VSSRSLRILLVADSLDAGGAERHVVGLAASLVRESHAVTIACSTGGALVDLARRNGATVIPLTSARAKRQVSLRFARALVRLTNSHCFDLVHAHMYASAAASAIATGWSGTPLVLTEHSEAGWRGPWARLVSRVMYRRARHIIAVSESIRQRLIVQDRVPLAQVTVIANALPELMEGYLPFPLAALSGLSGRALVGVVARLQPEKGVQHFLQAAAMVAAATPRVGFVIVGDGPQRSQLETLAAEVGIAGRSVFLGYQPDARSIMSMLDVLVVPSVSEGTPLVVLEAMAAGVPVVASAVGGIPEQVHHGCEGLLVPPCDPAALARAIQELLCDPDLAHRLGKAGEIRVSSAYSAEAMLRSTLRIYQVSSRQPSTCHSSA